MGFLSKIEKSVKKVVKNVTRSVFNPVNTIKNSVLLGPIGGQAGAAVYGPNATVKEAATATVLGAAAVAAGGLAGGEFSAAAGSSGVATGSTAGAASTVPAYSGALNLSITDPLLARFGQEVSKLFNPGAAQAAGSGYVAPPDEGTAKKSVNWMWLVGIGGGLLLLWLILKR